MSKRTTKKDPAAEAMRVLKKALRVMDLMRAQIGILTWERDRLAKKLKARRSPGQGGGKP